MSQSDLTFPLIIPYDGPDYFNDGEITNLVPLPDPFLRPVSWEELKRLGGRSVVLGSPWGQYYKLECETDSEWEKNYRISDAVKSLENAAEEIKEAQNNEGSVEASSAFGSNLQQGGLFGASSGFSGFGAPNQNTSAFGASATLGSTAFGSSLSSASSKPGGLFGGSSGFGVDQNSATLAAKPSGLFGGFGGFGAPNKIFQAQQAPQPFPASAQLGSNSFGSSALSQAPNQGGWSSLTGFGSLGGGASTVGTGALTGNAIEHYALMETPSYPLTEVPKISLQDWFLGGDDSLENAFVSTTEKPEELRNLLLSLARPGFEVMLAVKVSGQKPDVLRISCACAYAIKILHRQGRDGFDFTLLHAPSSVLLDIALFARGTLIHAGIEHKVLQAAAIALTVPEPKDAKEVTYARAVAVMVARIICRFYVESTLAKDEVERAANLERHMAALIKDVIERPVTSPTPNLPPTANPRPVITAAAALCALVLAGALTFADELQQRREKDQRRAELAVGAVLSCIGFAVPLPYFAGASGIAAILGTLIVRHIWRPRDPGLRTALVIQTLQTVLWPLVRRREILPVGLAGLSFEEVSEFKMFFELTLQSAWMGYWQRA